jgi:hypothetical protein
MEKDKKEKTSRTTNLQKTEEKAKPEITRETRQENPKK